MNDGGGASPAAAAKFTKPSIPGVITVTCVDRRIVHFLSASRAGRVQHVSPQKECFPVSSIGIFSMASRYLFVAVREAELLSN